MKRSTKLGFACFLVAASIFWGCKHEENTEVEEQPATSTEAPSMGTESTSTMGTDFGSNQEAIPTPEPTGPR